MNTHICQHVKITELEGKEDIHRAVVEYLVADPEGREAAQVEAVAQVDLQEVAEALEVALVGPLLVFQGAAVRRMAEMDQGAAPILKMFNLEVSSLRGTSFWFYCLRC